MRRKKRDGGLVGFIFFMVIATIFASGAVAVYTIFMKPENKSQVPELIGYTTIDAVAKAENLGLVVQLEPVASTLPEGRVLAQSPQAGQELRQGQVIVLHVSQGGKLHTVPDVKGKTLAKAQEEIKAQGFSLGDVIRINEPNIKAGTVIAQSPGAPASVTAGKKIDLLVQEGSAQPENVTIPDVNRMTEAEARSILEAGGIKVQATDRVYSPLLPEGLAIETKPGAGTSIKAGQGVILKLATQKRPAGFMDSDNAAKRVTNTPPATSKPADSKTTTTAKTPESATPSRSVKVSIGGEGDVFIGDDYEGSKARTTTAAKPAASSTSSTSSTTSTTPAPAAASSSGGNKTARIRYVVPPLARPMDLRIEITDPAGKRNVMTKQVRSGESINTTAKYTQECVISIYLGGEFVWQERQK